MELSYSAHSPPILDAGMGLPIGEDGQQRSQAGVASIADLDQGTDACPSSETHMRNTKFGYQRSRCLRCKDI